MYTNINLVSLEGQAIIKYHLISQSAPDIRRKLQKLERGPTTPTSRLVESAFRVFNNRDLEADTKEDKRAEQTASSLALAIQG